MSDPNVTIAILTAVIPLLAVVAGYGALRQTVKGLESRLDRLEESHETALADTRVSIRRLYERVESVDREVHEFRSESAMDRGLIKADIATQVGDMKAHFGELLGQLEGKIDFLVQTSRR